MAAKGVDLDDLLESALEDLEQQEKQTPQPTKPPQSPSPLLPSIISNNNSNNSTHNNNNYNNNSNNNNTPKKSTDKDPSKPTGEEHDEEILSEQFAAEMRKLMAGFNSGDIESTIREMQNLAAGVPPPAPPESPSAPVGGVSSGPFEDNIANTLKMLAENAKNVDTQAPGDLDPAAMETLMEQFTNNSEFQTAMEGMVQQLISKDILYDPMKELREKYPGWLKANEGKLPEEDYRRYIKQYECIQRICTTYESNSESLQDIITLMQEMAEYGQPPQEIMHDLAPGVQFGPDGMPALPGSDPNNPGCSIM